MATQYLHLPQGNLAYDDQGSGPLVVCSPSLGDVRGEYRFLAPMLAAAGFRVVTVDLRGHGESSAGWPEYSVQAAGGDLAALIRGLDAGPAVIAATSFSAAAAVWAAAEAPELVSGLVLIGPFVRGTSPWYHHLLFGAMFARPWGPAMWQRYYTSLYPTCPPADLTAYTAALRANLAEPGRLEAMRKVLLAPKTAAEARLGRVGKPALVVMGSKDPDFKDPAAEAHWVREQLSGELAIIENAGHYPHAEMPEQAGAAILPFLRSLADGPGEGSRG